MSALVSRLKHAARRLQRSIEAGEHPAPAELEAGESLQRRHCLHALAQRVGFRGWTQAKAVLEGQDVADRGRLMYRDSAGAISNIWSASYDEAREIRAATGGFLLPFDRQFQVVQADFVDWLGLDPGHRDWDAIGRDWVRPAERSAWVRITDRRLDVLLGEKDLARDDEPGTVKARPKR